MLKYLLILIFLFLSSCFIGKIGKPSPKGAKPPAQHDADINLADNVLLDSIHVDLVDDIWSANKEITKETSTTYTGSASAKLSSETYTHSPMLKDASNPLKIIEIKNTKVVKESSDLSEGRIVYKIPDKMKVRTTYKVLVRISKSKSTVSIYDRLKGVVMASSIPVTETMEVRLIDLSPDDNKAFEMADGNSAIQIVEDGDTYTEWNWAVTPVKVGKSKLKIVISVIRNGNKKDVVYEDSVEVERDVIKQTTFFICKYWQWILSTLVVPFVIWLYKRKKSVPKAESDTD